MSIPDTNNSFRERRKHPRAQINVEVLCFKSPEDTRRGAGILKFFSKDISVGGIFLETTVPLEVDSIIYLKFTIPGSPKTITTQARVINTMGRVVRINKGDSKNIPGMGVEFQHMGFDDQKLIDVFIKEKI